MKHASNNNSGIYDEFIHHPIFHKDSFDKLTT